MDGVRASGFWSYARADDEAEAGRIAELARDVKAEYALLTGEDLELFIDRDLVWGEQWRTRIDEALAGVTFFIPMVTPRFFQREECRRELLVFQSRARAAGVGELLLPILYADVDGLEEDAEDEALRAVALTQWENWRDLRLADRGSQAYREGVNRLATRLKDIAAAVAERPVITGGEAAGDASAKLVEAREALVELRNGLEAAEENDLGIVDLMARAEEVMPRMVDTITEIGTVLEEIGRLAEGSSERLLSAGGESSFAVRVRELKRFAAELEEPSNRLVELSTEYASDLRRVDPGYLAMIDLAKSADAEDEINAAQEFRDSVNTMVITSQQAVEQVRELSRMLEQAASFSRDLRPVALKIRDSLRRVADGQAVMDGWLARFDEA